MFVFYEMNISWLEIFLKQYGKGVQELASLPNFSLVIELHIMCQFFSGFVGMDVRMVQGLLLKGLVLGIC